MKLGFWQWWVIVNTVFSLGLSALLDGKPKLDLFGNPVKHSFAIALFNAICNLAILYFGGFFG